MYPVIYIYILFKSYQIQNDERDINYIILTRNVEGIKHENNRQPFTHTATYNKAENSFMKPIKD